MNNSFSIHRSVIRKCMISSRLWEERRKSVCFSNIVNAVCAGIYWSSCHKQKCIACKMNTSARSVNCILHHDLRLGAYWCCVSHLLNARLKEQRFLRCIKLLKWFSRKRRHHILFTNEKIFCIEKKVNLQNDRILVENCYKVQEWVPGVQQSHFPVCVIIYGEGGVLYYGATKINFCEAVMKTNSKVYCSGYRAWAPQRYSLNWYFQQDSAPGHKVKNTNLVNRTCSRFHHVERMTGSKSRPQPSRLPFVAATWEGCLQTGKLQSELFESQYC